MKSIYSLVTIIHQNTNTILEHGLYPVVIKMESMQSSQKLTSYTSMERSHRVELGSRTGRFESAPIESHEDSSLKIRDTRVPYEN